ncbi:MAG: FtsX-like permease family protein [Bacteroidales bacterium]|nr:FtsX-like permease family protein [Bacteroidales bacterium]
MKPDFFIAKRYLFARKSHNVINIISIISAAGIAIGCAALVIILSIYNGFDTLVKDLYDSTSPDLLITPARGKTFSTGTAAFDALRSDAAIASYSEILEENVFLMYGDNHTVVTARGVDSLYGRASGLDGYMTSGEFTVWEGGSPRMVLAAKISGQLGVNIRFLTPVSAIYPSTTDTLNIFNPASILRTEKIFPAGTISVDENFDGKYVFMPREVLGSLTGHDEISSVELRFVPQVLTSDGIVSSSVQKSIAKALGDDYVVRNRYQQNESLYKVMRYEKLAVYFILVFVMLIISCNALGSLSMLIIDKNEDIEVLKSMGATKQRIRRIFRLEGWMISLLGIVVGIAVGLLVCFLQARYGLVKLPGNFVVDAYPVKVQWGDVTLVFVIVAAIGAIMAQLPVKSGIK